MPTTNTRSGNPAKKAAAKKTAAKKVAAPAAPDGPNEDGKYAASSWGSDSAIGGVTDLTVPSGQLCLVKRPGVEGLLREGVLRDIDSFTALVNAEHVQRVKGKGKKAGAKGARAQEQEISQLLSDPDKVVGVMRTIEKVICHVVVKPAVQPTPNDPTRRKPGVVYADMIDLPDKMFIFNFVVGGSRDIERFLDESDRALGDVDSGEAVEDPTE